jgi:hypothetical protein
MCFFAADQRTPPVNAYGHDKAQLPFDGAEA